MQPSRHMYTKTKVNVLKIPEYQCVSLSKTKQHLSDMTGVALYFK